MGVRHEVVFLLAGGLQASAPRCRTVGSAGQHGERAMIDPMQLGVVSSQRLDSVPIDVVFIELVQLCLGNLPQVAEWSVVTEVTLI